MSSSFYALVTSAIITTVLAAPALAGTKAISVNDDYFVRDGATPTVTVNRGTTVRWTFRGDSKHNVTASGPARFRSTTMRSGTYSRKMTRAGTYTVICTLHSPDMRMKLKVR